MNTHTTIFFHRLSLGTVAILALLLFPFEAAAQWHQPYTVNTVDAIDRLSNPKYSGYVFGLSRSGVVYRSYLDLPRWSKYAISKDSGYNALTRDAYYAVGNECKIWPVQRSSPPATASNVVSDADLYCGDYYYGGGSRLKLLAAGARGTVVAHSHNRDSLLLLTENRFPDLYDILELESRRIWAVGDSGTVVVSTDHGKTWNERKRTPAHEYRNVMQSSYSTYIITGRDKIRGCALVILTNKALSVWQEYTFPDYPDITDVVPLHAGTGLLMMTGSRGLLVKSTDSGKTWQHCAHGTKIDFTAISVDRAWIFATGRSPIDGHFRFVSSADTGKTWRMTLEKEDSMKIYCTPSSSTWYVTNAGMVLEDQTSSVSYPANLKGMLSIDPRCCLALGYKKFLVGGMGGMLASGPGSVESWTTAHVLDDDFLSLDGNGGDSLIAIGSRGIYMSPDSGKSWEFLRYYAAGEKVTRLRYISRSSCISVGSHNGQGVLKRSDDGGAAWRTMLAQPAEITGFSVDSSDFIYACTADGLVLKSMDGGASWTTLLSEPAQRFRDISSGSRTDIFLLRDGETVMHSRDGGTSWKTQFHSGEALEHIKAWRGSYMAWGVDASFVRYNYNKSAYRFRHLNPDVYAVAARDDKFAIAVGEKGSVHRFDFSGLEHHDTFYPMQGPTLTQLNLNDVAWLNDNTTVAVGDSGIVLRGSMLSFSWDIVRQDTADGNLTQVFGLASGVAIAAGDGVLLRSDSTGESWTSLPRYPGMRLAMFDDRMWNTVSKQGDVYLSEDAGRTWGKTGVCPGAVYDLGIMGDSRLLALSRDESLGYARFILYCSMDFGASWYPLMQTTDEIRRMRVFDESRVFLLGPDGIVHIGDDYGRAWRTERSKQRKTFNDVIRMYPYKYCFSGEDRVIDIFEMRAPVTTTADPLPVSSELVIRNVYPNPAVDHLTVSLEASAVRSFHLSLHNTLGAVVWRAQVESSPGGPTSIMVSTAGLPSGMYYLRLGGSAAAETRRVVIHH